MRHRSSTCSPPAIIVAAGPSLDDNIQQLLVLHGRGRRSLRRLLTALRPLRAGGIRPHLVVAVDPSERNAMHLIGADSDGSWLVSEGSVDPGRRAGIYRSSVRLQGSATPSLAMAADAWLRARLAARVGFRRDDRLRSRMSDGMRSNRVHWHRTCPIPTDSTIAEAPLTKVPSACSPRPRPGLKPSPAGCVSTIGLTWPPNRPARRRSRLDSGFRAVSQSAGVASGRRPPATRPERDRGWQSWTATASRRPTSADIVPAPDRGDDRIRAQLRASWNESRNERRQFLPDLETRAGAA